MLAMNRLTQGEWEVLNNCPGISTVCLCICEAACFWFFRDNVWSVISGHATDSTSSIVLHDVKEIETWILKLLSSPVPIPGKTK